jgi:hypothetical protein
MLSGASVLMDAMDFSVNPKALGGLVDMLDNRADDLAYSSSYLAQHSQLVWGAGLINDLCRTHQRIVAEVEGFLHRAGQDYCAPYSVAVGRALRAYNETDQATSAKIDAALPGFVDPSIPDHLANQSLGPEIFRDRFPLRLETPPDFSLSHPYHPSWFDLLSPSSITRDVIWSASWLLTRLGLLNQPCDPYQAFTEPICGDWAGLERVSYALLQLVNALMFVSNRVDDGATTLDRVWTGHAAGNCRHALKGYARDLGPAQDLLIQIASQYHQVAEAARKHGEALATAVTVLVDIGGSLGIEFGVELAVDAVADAERLAQIGRALDEAIQALKTGVELLHVVIEGAHTDLESLTDQLALLIPRPFNVNMPDDMPALPTPAHR